MTETKTDVAMSDLFGDDSSSSDDENELQQIVTSSKTVMDDSSEEDGNNDVIQESKGKKKLLLEKAAAAAAARENYNYSNGDVKNKKEEVHAETQLSTHNPLIEDHQDGNDNDVATDVNEDTLALVVPRKVLMLDADRPLEKISNLIVHSTKLPNIVGIQTEAFERDTYNPDNEQKEFHGYTHNLIRWRYKRDKQTQQLIRDGENKLVRESNTRFIKYSDGSIQLQIGEERFEVDAHPSGHSFVFLTQKATIEDDNGRDVDVTLLESQGPAVSSKLLARPSSLQGAAHRTMTLALRQKTMKSSRIVEVSTTHDPEMIKQQKIKMKDDLMKDERRRSAGKAPTRRRPGMNRSYLDEDDDDRYESTNVGSMKKNIKHGSYGDDNTGMYDDDEDDVEADRWQQRKTARRPGAGSKRSRMVDKESDSDSSSADDDVEFGGNDSSDDDDVALTSRKKKATKSTHQFESDSE